MPPFQQERILIEQKYPKQGPTAFRIPYYRPALMAIAHYYRAQRNPAVLQNAVMQMSTRSGGAQVRITNNARVIGAFKASREASRALRPTPSKTLHASIYGVDVRLSPDLVASIGGSTKIIFYNCRTTVLDPEMARLTLELSHHVLAQNGISIPLSDLEYVDLARYAVYSFGKSRKSSTGKIRACSRVIKGLWPQI